MSVDTDIADRLAQIGSLQAGWFEGHGAAIDPQAVLSAKPIARAMSDSEGRPGIFPMENGGVLVEQALPGPSIRSVEVNPDGSFDILDLPTGRSAAAHSVGDALDVLGAFSDAP